MPSPLLAISKYTLVNALGRGVDASFSRLKESQSGISRCDFENIELQTWIGRAAGLEEEPIVDELARFDCRNNRLALAALKMDNFMQAVAESKHRYGADRIGLFLGTSTSGIRQTEMAYEYAATHGKLPDDFDFFCTHNNYSVVDFSRRILELQGPAYAISTACSSSAKVFAVAYRNIMAGLCDAAIVGGVDSLCGMTLYGFNSLELVSSQMCKPWDVDRDGISIGEAAGFALLERPEQSPDSVMLLGYGESSDAHHMSTPHPQGEGAVLAMQRALASAKMEASEVNYVNLHGTATKSNDKSEDNAVSKIFDNTPCSSTKGWTGHTLGAAGITEAIFSCLSIENNFMPGTLNLKNKDPELNANVLLENQNREVNVAISNSFGFGGTNCSLAIGTIQ